MFGDISFIFVDNINVLTYWKGLVNLNSLDGVVGGKWDISDKSWERSNSGTVSQWSQT
jgi:hypothetical protein